MQPKTLISAEAKKAWLGHLATFIQGGHLYTVTRWPPLYCYKVATKGDQANHIVAFLASADIKVFDRTYLPIYNAASDWPRILFYTQSVLFSISLATFWKYK